ncbi:MAG: hypothetical protein KDD58_13010 [Bdellovibrionales bacterium]|nr:hypothetical protein [Bdellovibrionales bacterium]
MQSFMEGPSGWMKAPVRMANGMAKDMGMDPMKMMLSMCKSPMGSAGASAFKMFGRMWPGATEELISEMKKMMYNPYMVVEAIDCASQSYEVFDLMKSVIQQDHTLVYYLGMQMISQEPVAKAMMRLARTPYQSRNPQTQKVVVLGYPGAELLLTVLDSLVFSQMTTAMNRYPQMVMALLDVVEKNKELAFDFRLGRGSMMYTLMDWRQPQHSYDGSEIALEQFIYIVLSDLNSANKFFEIIEAIDVNNKKHLLDILFLGKRFNYDKRTNTLAEDTKYVKNRSQYHIYALVDGLYDALMSSDDGVPPKTLQEVKPEAMALMKSMMNYMVDENQNPTEWAGAFMQGLANSILIHSEVPTEKGKVLNFCELKTVDMENLDNPQYSPSRHQRFYCLLRRMMSRVPTFKNYQPDPDPNSVAPRDYMNFKPVMPY